MKSPIALSLATVAALAASTLVVGCSNTSSTPDSAAAPDKEMQSLDPATRAGRIQTLFATGKFEEAEAALTAALAEFPDSPELQSVHYQAATALSRAGRDEEAIKHLHSYVEFELKATAARPSAAFRFNAALDSLVEFAAELHGDQRAEQILDEFTASAKKHPDAAPTLLASIDGVRAVHRARTGSADDARALVDQLQATAAAALEEAPADYRTFERMANALQTRINVESIIDANNAAPATAYDALLEFLYAHAKAHSDPRVLARFETDHLRRAQSLSYNNPDEAQALVDRIAGLMKLPQDRDSVAKAVLDPSIPRAHKRVADTIALALRRRTTIGDPALYPDHADRWVNAAKPLTSADLRGKVVLIDFFAVWCGPCIATFPHIRDWNERYADRGLQIIGVSEYQSFGWDEAAGRAKKIENLNPDQERNDLEKFAAYHKLTYPIALVPDDRMQQRSFVNGIPHVVLIDRAGKVRLHRVANDPGNVAALDKAIEECLAEPAPTSPAT